MICKPIKGQSKATKTSQLIHKNDTYWWENLDWCWTRKIFALRLSSVEETDSSSSSWKSTSRQWWSDWILENKREFLRIILCFVIIGLTKSGRTAWQEEEEDKSKDFSIVLILQEQNSIPPSSSRSFRTQSHWSYTALHDKVLIPNNFFEYICHRGCAINLHSIVNSGLIPGGQNLSNRQTVFFLLVDPMDKEHKDPDAIDLEAPRLAQYMHKAWKKHQKHDVLGRYQTCSKKRIEVLSDAIERYHSSRKTPSLLYPESCSDGNLRSHIRKSLCTISASSKDFLKHDWMKELGSEVARQPEGEVARQAKKSPTNPANPKSKSWYNRGDPLFAQKERPVLRKSKHVPLVKKLKITTERRDPLIAHNERLNHVSLVTARTSSWKKKQLTIARGDPLSAHNQSVQC